MDRSLEEVAQVRLAPGPADPGRRREAEEEREGREEADDLGRSRKVDGFDENIGKGDHDRGDEEQCPKRHRRHPALRDPAGAEGRAPECKRGIPADAEEPRDRDDLVQPRCGAERDESEHADDRQDRAADQEHPTRRPAEVADQPEHRVGRDREQEQDHTDQPRLLPELEDLGRAREEDHPRDRPEEEDRVPCRPRRLLQRSPEDGGEEADEEDLVGNVNQLECSHLRSEARFWRRSSTDRAIGRTLAHWPIRTALRGRGWPGR